MFDYSQNELQSIDQQLEPLLNYANTRVNETQQLALDATRILSCTEERLNDYKGKGFFKRCWDTITGKTGEIQRANQKDLITMQKYSWRYINLLQERDLLLAHSLITVKNNLLTLAIKEEETRNEIANMAERIQERFKLLEDRMKNVEVELKIHNWLLTISDRDYDEKYTPHFRLLKLINDFIKLKDTDWNINEIKCLRTAVNNVGLLWKREITLGEFIDELIEEIERSKLSVYQDLIFIESETSDRFIPFIADNIAVPSFNSLFNLAGNYSGTSSAIEILDNDLKISRKNALKKVLFKYIQNQGVDLEIKFQLRDLAVELLSCMRLSKNLYNAFNQGTLNYSTNDSPDSSKEYIKNDTPPGSNQNLSSLLKLAKQGDRDAQYELGTRYECGDEEVKKDVEVARDWFHKAAEAGHIKAQSKLADLLCNVFFPIEDDKLKEEAFEWAKLAAEAGDADAQTLLASLYEDGLLVKQNKSEAFGWYKKAAEQGNQNAIISLAGMYCWGDGLPENKAKAFELINKACDIERNLISLTHLAAMYLFGVGTNNSYSKAIENIEKIKDMFKSENVKISSKSEFIELILKYAEKYFENKKNFYSLVMEEAMPQTESFSTFFEPLKENEDIAAASEGIVYWSKKGNGFIVSNSTLYWCIRVFDEKQAPFAWEGFESVSLATNSDIIKFNNVPCLDMTGSDLNHNQKKTLIDLIKLLHILSID